LESKLGDWGLKAISCSTGNFIKTKLGDWGLKAISCARGNFIKTKLGDWDFPNNKWSRAPKA
jgi:hypothetical protein